MCIPSRAVLSVRSSPLVSYIPRDDALRQLGLALALHYELSVPPSLWNISLDPHPCPSRVAFPWL